MANNVVGIGQEDSSNLLDKLYRSSQANTNSVWHVQFLSILFPLWFLVSAGTNAFRFCFFLVLSIPPKINKL